MSARFALLSVVLLGAAPLAPAVAQAGEPVAVSSAEASREAICQVRTNEALGPAVGNAKPVMAICQSHGLMLGYADTFEVTRNENLNAVLVDLRHGSERRVLLISLQADGPPLLEDVSGQIAMTAGRGPISPLDGIEVDVEGFARNGAIAVLAQPEGSGGSQRAGTINLGQQVMQARASRRGTPAQE